MKRLALWIVLAPASVRADVATALAKEKLAGTVLVRGDAPLQPNAAAAKAMTGPFKSSGLAMKVVKDHGDVVELSTAYVEDCVAPFRSDYELAVFVPRTALVPRAGADLIKTYKDGTAVAIDRGAPIVINAGKLAWQDELLAATAISPDPNAVRYAVDKLTTRALPDAGEPLICDPLPTTRAKWKEQQASLADAHRKAQADEDRRKVEQARAECYAQQKKKPNPKPSSKNDIVALLEMDDCATIGTLPDLTASGGMFDLDGGDQFAPWCGVSEYRDWQSSTKLPGPVLDGKTLPWLLSGVHRDDHVVRAGDNYLADLEVACGRVRVLVTHAAVRRGGAAGIGGIGTGGTKKPKQWSVKAGSVTWPDGTPAGKLTSSRIYNEHQAEVVGDKLCVRVNGIAERVCHRKKSFAEIK